MTTLTQQLQRRTHFYGIDSSRHAELSAWLEAAVQHYMPDLHSSILNSGIPEEIILYSDYDNPPFDLNHEITLASPPLTEELAQALRYHYAPDKPHHYDSPPSDVTEALTLLWQQYLARQDHALQSSAQKSRDFLLKHYDLLAAQQAVPIVPRDQLIALIDRHMQSQLFRLGAAYGTQTIAFQIPAGLEKEPIDSPLSQQVAGTLIHEMLHASTIGFDATHIRQMMDAFVRDNWQQQMLAIATSYCNRQDALNEAKASLASVPAEYLPLLASLLTIPSRKLASISSEVREILTPLADGTLVDIITLLQTVPPETLKLLFAAQSKLQDLLTPYKDNGPVKPHIDASLAAFKSQITAMESWSLTPAPPPQTEQALSVLADHLLAAAPQDMPSFAYFVLRSYHQPTIHQQMHAESYQAVVESLHQTLLESMKAFVCHIESFPGYGPCYLPDGTETILGELIGYREKQAIDPQREPSLSKGLFNAQRLATANQAYHHFQTPEELLAEVFTLIHGATTRYQRGSRD